MTKDRALSIDAIFSLRRLWPLLFFLSVALTSPSPTLGAHLNPGYVGRIDFSGPLSSVAVNPTTNQVLLTGAEALVVVDGVTNQVVCSVELPPGSSAIRSAVNPITGRAYVAHGAGQVGVSVVDLSSCSLVGTVPILDTDNATPLNTAGGIAVDPNANLIYVSFLSFVTPDAVAVIDGATATRIGTYAASDVFNISVNSIAVNPTTNRIYVTNPGNDSVAVIEGATGSVTAIPVARPAAVAVNAVTNRVYVTSPAFTQSDQPFTGVTVLDGGTNAVVGSIPLDAAIGAGVGVNPDTNQIYVAGGGSTIDVFVIDGTSNAVAGSLPLICGNSGDVAVNPVSDLVYIASTCSRVFVVGDGLAAQAGPDQTVAEGSAVALSGAATGGAPPYSFSWTQTSGAPVILSDPTASAPTFTAPTAPDTLTFELTVTDAFTAQATDTVTISVVPQARADLALAMADSPDPVILGAPLTYTLIVTTRGPDTAVGVTVTDTLPAGVALTSTAASQGSCSGASTVTCALGSLGSGATASVTIVVTPTIAGPVGNSASVANTTPDPDLTNNTAATTTIVQAGSPDLVESNVTSPPAHAKPGDSFSVTDTVVNAGTRLATRSATGYYLSLDSVRSAGDVRLTGRRSVPNLAPGTSSTGAATVSIPRSITPGQYFLLACADDTGVLAESDELNNCRASAARVDVALATTTLPDLVEIAVSDPPAVVARGTSFAVTDSVQNQGATAATAFAVGYFLSTTPTPVAGGTTLSGRRAIAGLAAGATSTGTVSVRVHELTTVGTYFLIACVDGNSQIVEGNETNNCRVAANPVLVGAPDLVQTEVSDPPAAIRRGARFAITDSVQNQGTTAATTFSVGYFLSTTPTPVAAGVNLTGRRRVTGLAANEISTGTTSVRVHELTMPGTYFLIACADVNSQIAEENAGNNCRIAAAQVTVTP